MRLRLNLIYAQAANRVIGQNNQLPWHLPEDLAHFKKMTAACPVIMGRKTWDSLPKAFRPLPGRRNVVITRQADWHEPGAEACHSLTQALAMLASTPPQAQDDAKAVDVWVIGGAQIYQQALPLADRIVVTELKASFEGDAYAPELDGSWQACSVADVSDPDRHGHDANNANHANNANNWLQAANGLHYRFVVYENTKNIKGF